MNYSKQNRKGSEKMNKRKKKKASSKSANLKKPVSLLIKREEIAKVLAKDVMHQIPTHSTTDDKVIFKTEDSD